MTEVAFHFNAPDKLGYVCRFARKALRHGARLAILGSPELLGHLSTRLWSVAPTEFLAHARQGEAEHIMAASPIVLLEQLDGTPHHEVLLNLSEQVPQGFERFARVVEVVGAEDEQDRHLARQRWRHYASMGLAIVRHDLVLKD
ncbi:DNA polymerase III subunit chi [Delftia sp. PS-11]|uniref:DNA polymerase III subunit chi n=1 Tax=Delftia sp. PS-11 TaxID=2767222 RepID=UPI002456D4B5|nr:DNA polymerase III subunit chi [Delftia sp. PS-11]KAJ8740796.1 DNA polymerase III subunit chi [Delftia sp. PS-11]